MTEEKKQDTANPHLKEFKEDMELLVRLEQVKNMLKISDFPEMLLTENASEEEMRDCLAIRKLKTLYRNITK